MLTQDCPGDNSRILTGESTHCDGLSRRIGSTAVAAVASAATYLRRGSTGVGLLTDRGEVLVMSD